MIFLLKILVIPLDMMVMAALFFLFICPEAKPEKKSLYLSGAFLLLLCACTAAGLESLAAGLMFLYPLLLVIYYIPKNRVRKFFLFLFLLFLLSFPVNTYYFLMSVWGTLNLNEPAIHMDIIVNVIVILCAYRYRKYATEIHFSRLEILIAFSLWFFTSLLGILLNPQNHLLSDEVYKDSSDQFLIASFSAAIVVLNVLFLITVWKNKTSDYYKLLNTKNREYIQRELQYFEAYKSSQSDLRKFRHDMKHHINYMQYLCQTGNTAGMKDYLNQLQTNWETTAASLYHTGDDTADSILNMEAFFMEKSQIRFTLTGAFAGRLPISAFDICTIFSNALDNAIEENQKIEPAGSRCISVSICRNNYYYIVSIENPLHEGYKRAEVSSKGDKKNHGYGLRSIRETAEANGGYISAKSDASSYILDIFLPI